MKIWPRLFLLLSSLTFVALVFTSSILAASQSELEQKIEEYEQKIAEAQGKQKTLISAITVFNSQIYLAEARIEKTTQEMFILKDEIEELSDKITLLDKNLDDTLILLNKRIEQTYKSSFLPSFYFLVSSQKFSDFLMQFKYMKAVQSNDRKVLFGMEQTKLNFDKQKQLKEEKQTELEKLQIYLESQKVILNQQKTSKQQLLEVTKNDETTYQQLKKEAERELNALLSAKFVGKREVKKGETLGIMGSTGFSTGPHLHFGLYELGESDLDKWNYYNDIDANSYLSQYQWPFDGEIKITQGRGITSFSSVYSDGFHHGIDMYSSNKMIKAVNNGVAYFFRNPSGSLGNHVKVFHSDGKMTIYCHME